MRLKYGGFGLQHFDNARCLIWHLIVLLFYTSVCQIGFDFIFGVLVWRKRKSVWLNISLHDNTCINMSYLQDIHVVLSDLAKYKTIKTRILPPLSGERNKPESVPKIHHFKQNSNLQKMNIKMIFMPTHKYHCSKL